VKKLVHISFLVSLLLGLIILCGTVALVQSGWVSQTSGTTELLYGVFFTDANTGTAVGVRGTILRTTDGGATWTSKTQTKRMILIDHSGRLGIPSDAIGGIRNTAVL